MNIFNLLKRNYNIKYLLEDTSDRESLYKYIFDKCSLYRIEDEVDDNEHITDIGFYYNGEIIIEANDANCFIYENPFYEHINSSKNNKIIFITEMYIHLKFILNLRNDRRLSVRDVSHNIDRTYYDIFYKEEFLLKKSKYS